MNQPRSSWGNGGLVDDHQLPRHRLTDLFRNSTHRRKVTGSIRVLGGSDSDEYDSLGGFLYHELGRIPSPGEIVEMEEALITVQSANARQIQTVHISPKPIPEKA